MIRDHQTEELFKEILANLYRLVVIYSCEVIKAQNIFPDMYQWFEDNNKVVDIEIRKFLKEKKGENFSIKIDSFDKVINFDLSEEDIVYELNQYFWDFKQFHDVSYNRALISELKIETKEIEQLFKILIENMTLPKDKGPIVNFFDLYNFTENYNLSSFISKDRTNRTIFRYFQLYAEIVSPNFQFENKNLQQKFIDLLREIPYYSIFARTTMTGFCTFNTSQGKIYYSTLKVPLNFKKGTLLDSLLHFLFQHLIELFYSDFLKDDPKAFKLKLAIGEKRKKEIASKHEKLHECNDIMKLLLQAWPKEQHLVYRKVEKEGSIIPVLRSILYENFLKQYEQSKIDDHDFNNNLKSKKKQKNLAARTRISAFFKYLEYGFLEMGFKVKIFDNDDKTDNWKIICTSNPKNEKGNFEWTWNQIKSSYDNHKNKTNLFNYE